MTSAIVSRWSRALVAAGVGFFALVHLAVAADVGRPATVVLGLYGFVFGVVFGKGYSLIPSYFARELAVARAPAIHLPLHVVGTAGLALEALDVLAAYAGPIGRWCWLGGVVAFVATIGWTVRDNLSGRETGTGEVNVHRERIDRASNAVVPVVLAYLLVGASLAAVGSTALPGRGPASTHLLAAGSAALLVFAVGFRLLPRFLVASPRPALVAVVLPAGAVAPALLAWDFLGGAAFRAGAALQSIAVVGFAIAYADLYRRSDRRRVGFHGVLAGAVFGVATVALGLWFALVGFDAPVPGGASGLVEAHYRLALRGFLGLIIVGVTFQFYPPAIGERAGVDDRTALVAIGLLAAGLAIEVGGLLAGHGSVERVGSIVALAGAIVYVFVIFALFLERR